MATFKWNHRKHPANCAANVPLLDEMIRLYDSSSVPSDGNAPVGYPSKMQRAYGNAIESIAKYPLEITSAEEAEQLHGIGSFLAARIGRILAGQLGVAPSPATASVLPAVASAAAAVPAAKAKAKRKPKGDGEAPASNAASSTAAAAAASSNAAAPALPRAASVAPPLPPMPSLLSPDTLSALLSSSFSPPRSARARPSVAVVSPEVRQASQSLTAFLPECPFGEFCYRTNVQHFLEQSHPRRHERAIAIAREETDREREEAEVDMTTERETERKRQHPSPNKRAREEICLLSEGEDSRSSPLPSPPARPPPPKKPRVAPHALWPTKARAKPHQSKVDDEDDFMMSDEEQQGEVDPAGEEDDEEDFVDLTSPPPVAPSCAFSTPPLSAHPPVPPPAPAASAASSVRPPPHPAAATAAGLWSLPPAPAAAAAKKVTKPPSTASVGVDGDKATSKMYKPKSGSAAHALLLALARATGPLSKSSLLSAALSCYPAEKQVGLEESAVLSTLAGGLATLITRDLADKSLTPVQYAITKLGRETAHAMAPANHIPTFLTAPSPASSQDSFLSSPSPQMSPSSINRAHSSPMPTAAAAAAGSSSHVLPPARPSSSPPPVAPNVPLARRFCDAAEFEVVLLIDVRERSGRKDAAYMIDKLSARGVLCEARALSVGDFMYIARHRAHRSVEVVLDAIVERKRVSDLVASIRDGRYHEQRSRLKKTALARMAYVIEGVVAQETVHGLPIKTVETVLASMNGVHGLLVHHTPSIEPTISFIESLYRLAESELQRTGVPVVLPEASTFRPFQPNQAMPNLAELPSSSSSFHGVGESFVSFSCRLSKSANLLASELFGQQLRMIRGVSSGLALNILARFPSACALCDGYDRCRSVSEEDSMLEAISMGPFRRPAGRALSIKVRTFFRSADYE